jgi:hypothetical protein
MDMIVLILNPTVIRLLKPQMEILFQQIIIVMVNAKDHLILPLILKLVVLRKLFLGKWKYKYFLCTTTQTTQTTRVK